MIATNASGLRFARLGTWAAKWAGPVTVVCCALYLAGTLHKGWIPHDTGQLGHTAERVLRGELQHRDFDEPYTGGLGYLHALAFRAWGVRAESMRWVLLAYFCLFVAAVYLLARRAAGPWSASLVTFLSASLSVPMYAEGLPSWYNLFFATLGTLALLEHARTGKGRWLFWAGCAAGCSLVMKITGLYFVAAALLYFAYKDQCASDASRPVSRLFSVAMTALCALFGVVGLGFLRGARPEANAVHFTMPLVAIGVFLGWHEWQVGRGAFVERVRGLVRLLLPFSAGIVCLVMVFLIPYLASGSWGDLYRGLFVLPAARLDHASLPPPALKWFNLSLPVIGLMLAGIFPGRFPPPTRRQLVGLFAVLAGLFVYSGTPTGYFFLFQSLRHLIPPVVLLGLLVLVMNRQTVDRQTLFLLIAVAATSSLIQYPYAYGTYFFYCAPLLVLTILHLVANASPPVKVVHASLLVFAMLFAVLRLPQPDPRLLNGIYQPDFPVAAMNLSRCDLSVYAEDARVYQQLIELVQAHSTNDSYIYAAPDCPEVYFLAGRRNPTRTLYDLFDDPRADRLSGLVDVWQNHGVNVVVINCHPAFSRSFDPRLLNAIGGLYPHQESIIGARRPGAEPTELFRVFWRDGLYGSRRS